MPGPPTLPLSDKCPDSDCNVSIGERHRSRCIIAICVMTGQQRLIHDSIGATEDTDPGAAFHTCGKDVWVGYPHGALTAATHGLFARPSQQPGDPSLSWIPCSPDHPDARPDIPRLVSSGRWDPIAQVFELTPAVAG